MGATNNIDFDDLEALVKLAKDNRLVRLRVGDIEIQMDPAAVVYEPKPVDKGVFVPPVTQQPTFVRPTFIKQRPAPSGEK